MKELCGRRQREEEVYAPRIASLIYKSKVVYSVYICWILLHSQRQENWLYYSAALGGACCVYDGAAAIHRCARGVSLIDWKRKKKEKEKEETNRAKEGGASRPSIGCNRAGNASQVTAYLSYSRQNESRSQLEWCSDRLSLFLSVSLSRYLDLITLFCFCFCVRLKSPPVYTQVTCSSQQLSV